MFLWLLVSQGNFLLFFVKQSAAVWNVFHIILQQVLCWGNCLLQILLKALEDALLSQLLSTVSGNTDSGG